MILKLKNHKFHQYKGPILIKNIDINKIVIHNKISFNKPVFKYFIGYKDAKKFQTFMHIPSKTEYMQKRI